MFPIWHRLRVRASVRPIVERLADPPTLNPNLQQTRVPTDDDLDSMKSALTEKLIRCGEPGFARPRDLGESVKINLQLMRLSGRLWA